jgi:hypothetical protein
MGVLADLLANSATIDATLPREASDRVLCRKINDVIARLGDPSYPSGMDTAANEVQGIAIHEDGVDGGTFTLTFTLFGGVTFTTAAIAFGANAATIQAAIDTAADPVVQGFTAADIAITGGPLTTTPLVITFSGASVAAKNHGLTVIDGALLTDGGVPEDPGEVTVTTAGTPVRTAYASLIALGVLSAPAPAPGVTSGITVQNARGSFPNGLDEETVRMIVQQVVLEEGNQAIGDAILTAIGY